RARRRVCRSLVGARDLRLVLDTFAQTFGLHQQGNLTPADQLHGYLKDISLLLVLDNLEHVIEASPHIAELLAHARGLSVLATSRAVLRLRRAGLRRCATDGGVQL